MNKQKYHSERSERIHKMIGHNFKTLRTFRNVSIDDVAEATIISPYRLRKLEAGTLRVTPSILLAISDYFGLTIECMVYQDLVRLQ
jgi:transcriptional regulator with XRE-family HTH domain